MSKEQVYLGKGDPSGKELLRKTKAILAKSWDKPIGKTTNREVIQEAYRLVKKHHGNS